MNRQKVSTNTQSSNIKNLNFDDEAYALFKKLNIDPSTKNNSNYNWTDPIWRHPEGGGTIYVGNQPAAESITYLNQINVTHIVNCTYGASKIPDFHKGRLAYYNFTISHWTEKTNSTNASIFAFADPLFAFIDNAISNGKNVMIHCLAGAHRAGTTGCLCLMHFANLDVKSAIRTAKQCRYIIDPIGHLPEFLHRYQIALASRIKKEEDKEIMSNNRLQADLRGEEIATLEEIGTRSLANDKL
jgi:protein tyrosine/serine phosphatase